MGDLYSSSSSTMTAQNAQSSSSQQQTYTPINQLPQSYATQSAANKAAIGNTQTFSSEPGVYYHASVAQQQAFANLYPIGKSTLAGEMVATPQVISQPMLAPTPPPDFTGVYAGASAQNPVSGASTRFDIPAQQIYGEAHKAVPSGGSGVITSQYPVSYKGGMSLEDIQNWRNNWDRWGRNQQPPEATTYTEKAFPWLKYSKSGGSGSQLDAAAFLLGGAVNFERSMQSVGEKASTRPFTTVLETAASPVFLPFQAAEAYTQRGTSGLAEFGRDVVIGGVAYGGLAKVGMKIGSMLRPEISIQAKPLFREVYKAREGVGGEAPTVFMDKQVNWKPLDFESPALKENRLPVKTVENAFESDYVPKFSPPRGTWVVTDRPVVNLHPMFEPSGGTNYRVTVNFPNLEKPAGLISAWENLANWKAGFFSRDKPVENVFGYRQQEGLVPTSPVFTYPTNRLYPVGMVDFWIPPENALVPVYSRVAGFPSLKWLEGGGRFGSYPKAIEGDVFFGDKWVYRPPGKPFKPFDTPGKGGEGGGAGGSSSGDLTPGGKGTVQIIRFKPQPTKPKPPELKPIVKPIEIEVIKPKPPQPKPPQPITLVGEKIREIPKPPIVKPKTWDEVISKTKTREKVKPTVIYFDDTAAKEKPIVMPPILKPAYKDITGEKTKISESEKTKMDLLPVSMQPQAFKTILGTLTGTPKPTDTDFPPIPKLKEPKPEEPVPIIPTTQKPPSTSEKNYPRSDKYGEYVKTGKQTLKGFGVFVKKAGKWIKVSKRPLVREEAISLGTATVKASPIRSFAIRAEGETERGLYGVSQRLNELYAPKTVRFSGGQVFTQRPKYSIATVGEKMGLKQARLKGGRKWVS